MASEAGSIPYCGLPPSPGDLLSRWNLDPVLLLLLAAVAALYGAAAWYKPPGCGRVASFFAGLAILTLALVSPRASASTCSSCCWRRR